MLVSLAIELAVIVIDVFNVLPELDGGHLGNESCSGEQEEWYRIRAHKICL